MRRVIVHYPAAHPGLTWLCVTSTAIHNIATITLEALCTQYAKLLFQSCFFPLNTVIHYIHFICGSDAFVKSQCLLFCFNLSNVMS